MSIHSIPNSKLQEWQIYASNSESDVVTFGDVQDSSGNEIQLTVAAGKFIGVNLSELSGIRYLKVRSGTSGAPVNQGADRTISIVLTNNAEASAGATGGGAATIADGGDVTQGAKADAAVTDATATATLMAFVKGLVKILFGVWDSTNHFLKVSILRQQTTASTSIANAASLSSEIDLTGYSLAAIVMPSSWTTANLTFQASDVSGGTYQDVYDAAGNELSVVASASKVITDIPELAPIRFLKIRSGTTGTPVAQGGSRNLTLLLKG